VDGSPTNADALAWAAAAAAAHQVPLTLVHARPDAEGVARTVPSGNPVLDWAQEQVRAMQPNLDLRPVQYPLAPVPSLLAAAEQADAVVIGSRGMGGFRGLLLGSTALHLVPLAPCPVVVVHSRADGSDPHPPGPNAGSVVLGYDGSSAANRAAAFAFRHAAAIGAPVVVIGADEDLGSGEAQQVLPGDAVPGSDTGAFYAPLVVTGARFPDVDVTFRSVGGRAADALIEQSAGAALLVVGARGLGGVSGLLLGSVSQKATQYADCPVAVVHEGVPAARAGGGA
jgi:nucleotide-binding universal stress UspA family protein